MFLSIKKLFPSLYFCPQKVNLPYRAVYKTNFDFFAKVNSTFLLFLSEAKNCPSTLLL